MFRPEDVYSRESLIDSLKAVHLHVKSSFKSLTLDDFFARMDGRWSPAETLLHLIKSERPIVRAMRLPRFVLMLLFGTSAQPSRRYVQIRELYRKELQRGLDPGRFAPRLKEIPSSQREAEKLKRQLLEDWRKVGKGLIGCVQSWYDYNLDKYKLPHLALGKLTVREMLLFTLYHDLHHFNSVKRRLSSHSEE